MWNVLSVDYIHKSVVFCEFRYFLLLNLLRAGDIFIRRLNVWFFGRTHRLLPYFMCANSESSGETARMRRFAWAFAGRLCDKYDNFMSWLIYPRFFFSPIKISVTDFLAPVSNFYTHWERPSVLCEEKPKCWSLFLPSFSILLLFICHSNVIHRKICVKDFSGTTASRILKFGTNVGFDLLYCVNPLA